MQIDEAVVVLAAGALDHHGDVVDLVEGEGALFNELVRAQTVSMVGAVNDDGVIVQTLGLQFVHDHAYHIVDHGAVAVVAGSNLLKAFPTVVAQAPHLLTEIVPIGLIQQIVAIAGMLGNVGRVIHGIIGLRDDAGGMGSPEVCPDEEGLFLLLGLVNQPVCLVSHEVLDGAFHRPLMLAEHLLALKGGVVAHKPVGDIHIFKSVFL